MVKNIIFILKWGISYGGGGEKWIIRVASELVKLGNKVTFYIPKIYRDEENFLIPGINYIFYDSKIVSLFKKIGLMNFAWPFISPNITLQADTVYVPSVYSIRIIFNNARKGLHTVLSGHDYYLSNRKISRDIFIILSNLFLKIFHKNLTVHCPTSREEMKMKSLNVNAIYISNFPYSSGNKITISKKFRILFINRINQRKGSNILIKLIKELEDYNDIELKIAGTNDMGNKFTKALDVATNTVYLGYISEERKIQLLEESDLFLLLSDRESTVPISQLESMSSGLPVVSTWKYSMEELPVTMRNYIEISNRNVKDVLSSIMHFYSIWKYNPQDFLDMKHNIKKNYSLYNSNSISKIIDILV